MNVNRFFTPEAGKKAAVALFLSGTGSNAGVLLEYIKNSDAAFAVTVLVTDAPETSVAVKLSEKYGIPLVACDIRKFYMEHGENSIKLDTPRRRELRDEWSDELWRGLRDFKIDFGVFAGFIPLSNIVSRILCLNVHPGDLTVEVDGERIFAGLHILPVEKALLMGNPALRSSVILAQGYSGSGEKEMDTGYVLGISQKVPVDLQGYSLEDLRAVSDKRIVPPYDDPLRRVALANVESLKTGGDHLVLPEVTNLFASGRYGTDEQGRLCFLENDGEWKNISTVEVFKDKSLRLHYAKQ